MPFSDARSVSSVRNININHSSLGSCWKPLFWNSLPVSIDEMADSHQPNRCRRVHMDSAYGVYFRLFRKFQKSRFPTGRLSNRVNRPCFVFRFFFSFFGANCIQAFIIFSFRDSKNFLRFSRFRTIFSTLFFIPLILMLAIYIHISIIVRKHQASRRWFNRHSRRYDMTGEWVIIILFVKDNNKKKH